MVVVVAQTFAVIARRSNTSEPTFNKTRQHFCEKYAFIEKLENLLFVYKVINNDTESATAFCYVSLNSIIKSNIEKIVFPLGSSFFYSCLSVIFRLMQYSH